MISAARNSLHRAVERSYLMLPGVGVGARKSTWNHVWVRFASKRGSARVSATSAQAQITTARIITAADTAADNRDGRLRRRVADHVARLPWDAVHRLRFSRKEHPAREKQDAGNHQTLNPHEHARCFADHFGGRTLPPPPRSARQAARTDSLTGPHTAQGRPKAALHTSGSAARDLTHPASAARHCRLPPWCRWSACARWRSAAGSAGRRPSARCRTALHRRRAARRPRRRSGCG